MFKELQVIKGLDWTGQIPGYRDAIQAVTERYHKEGMPSEEEGSPQGAYDLAIIINRHSTPSNLLVRQPSLVDTLSGSKHPCRHCMLQV